MTAAAVAAPARTVSACRHRGAAAAIWSMAAIAAAQGAHPAPIAVTPSGRTEAMPSDRAASARIAMADPIAMAVWAAMHGLAVRLALTEMLDQEEKHDQIAKLVQGGMLVQEEKHGQIGMHAQGETLAQVAMLAFARVNAPRCPVKTSNHGKAPTRSLARVAPAATAVRGPNGARAVN